MQGVIGSSFMPQTNLPKVPLSGCRHGYIHSVSDIPSGKVASCYSSNSLFQCLLNKALDFTMLFRIEHDICHSLLYSLRSIQHVCSDDIICRLGYPLFR